MIMAKCYVETTLEEIENDWDKAVQTAALAAITMEGIDGEMTVVLTDNEYIQGLNNEFRHIDAPTDVLSFPENDLAEPLTDAIGSGFIPEEGDEARIALGDIYISVERAAQQAEEYGNTLTEELAFLTVHGALHLMGYDHIEPEDETIMREKQRKALGRE